MTPSACLPRCDHLEAQPRADGLHFPRGTHQCGHAMLWHDPGEIRTAVRQRDHRKPVRVGALCRARRSAGVVCRAGERPQCSGEDERRNGDGRQRGSTASLHDVLLSCERSHSAASIRRLSQVPGVSAFSSCRSVAHFSIGSVRMYVVAPTDTRLYVPRRSGSRGQAFPIWVAVRHRQPRVEQRLCTDHRSVHGQDLAARAFVASQTADVEVASTHQDLICARPLAGSPTPVP